jgi:hypothetical protein
MRREPQVPETLPPQLSPAIAKRDFNMLLGKSLDVTLQCNNLKARSKVRAKGCSDVLMHVSISPLLISSVSCRHPTALHLDKAYPGSIVPVYYCTPPTTPSSESMCVEVKGIGCSYSHTLSSTAPGSEDVNHPDPRCFRASQCRSTSKLVGKCKVTGPCSPSPEIRNHQTKPDPAGIPTSLVAMCHRVI